MIADRLIVDEFLRRLVRPASPRPEQIELARRRLRSAVDRERRRPRWLVEENGPHRSLRRI